MRWLRLRVEQINGERVTVGRALVRSAVLLLPFEVNHVVMFNLAPQSGPPPTAFYVGIALVWLLIGVYLASIVASPLGQSVHDRVAGTVVRDTR